jgi:hypothetical protein
MGTKKKMMLIGFALSLISITFNSVVISYVNGRLKAVDDERSKLAVSLERQAATQSDGDAQFAVYRLMHNLIFAVPRESQDNVAEDATSQLGLALQKWYQAAYDVPQTEMTKATNDDMAATVPLSEKAVKLQRAIESAQTSPEERDRLIKQQGDLEKQLPEPKSDLVRKIRELGKKAEEAEVAGSKSETELWSTLLPLMESFNAHALESSEKKRNRIRELEDERASLVTKANYASYGAIAFQLLGLMFIFARDLWTHKKAAETAAK